MIDSASENWLKSIVPFIVMCFGGFMALLDIQIVASSLQNIGGGLSAATLLRSLRTSPASWPRSL